MKLSDSSKFCLNDWKVRKGNVSVAFLNGAITDSDPAKRIFMTQPLGFEEERPVRLRTPSVTHKATTTNITNESRDRFFEFSLGFHGMLRMA
jgi:hypothetical protein